jgi:ADP-ribose pyrophosphatase
MSAKVNHTVEIHTGRVFRLITENVTLPNQATIDLDVIRHPGASAVVALTEAGEVLLLKQYRHALQEVIWEIPAGVLMEGEAPIDCARRELAEETGYTGKRFEKLAEIVPLPGYSDERVHLFIAEGLERGTQRLDADEVLEVVTMPFSEALTLLHRGAVVDAKSICGLLLAKQRRSGEGIG